MVSLCLVGCGQASPSSTGSGGGSTTSTTSNAGSQSASSASSSSGSGAGGSGGAGGASPVWVDSLESNRDRLLGAYFDFLKTSVTQPQTNGLSGTDVASVCDVWSKLDPSSRAVFLTITARLQASRLGADGSSMLWHVTKLYRVVGGQGATQSDPGSCGGGEFNRMMMSMDASLRTAMAAANAHQGALQGNGKYDLADAPPQGTFWRDSHDIGGAHAPFDASDETDQGAPRGQTQYFADPTSSLAQAPLGRQDLETLIDPEALEMDQDYNCPHDSNPLCTYTTYGPLCFPGAATLGADLFAAAYGNFDPGYQPASCP